MVYLKILFIFFLICIFLFYIPSPNYKEEFITWYLPFFNKGTRELTSDTPKYLTSNLIYGQLKFDYINKIFISILSKIQNSSENDFYNFFISSLTRSLKVKKVFVKNIYKPSKLIENVNNSNINISIVSSPLLMNYLSSKTKKIENINTIIVSNYRYIFFITTKFTNLSSISDFNNKKINVGFLESDEYILGNDILENINIKQNLNFIKTYFDPTTALKKLISGEIDGMFFTDIYPSQFLNNIILKDLDKLIILLPITGFNYQLFKTRHPYINEVALDLNTLPKNYLPVKVNNLEYNKFRPDLISYRYPDIMICNKNTQPRVSYQIANSLVSNLYILNQSKFFIKNQWNYLAFPEIAENLFIPTHIGAKVYYNQITINTTNPSAICKYFVGNAKCNDKRIEGANIVLSSQ